MTVDVDVDGYARDDRVTDTDAQIEGVLRHERRGFGGLYKALQCDR
jgi:hypothetical protein